MKIRSAAAAMVLVAAAGFAAGQQSGEPKDGSPALEPLEIREVEVPPTVTDVIYFDGRWVGSDFINDRISYFDSRGNVLGTNPLGLGVFNIYGGAGKMYFDAVNSAGRYQGGYLFKDKTLVGMFSPPGFVPAGVAVHPDDTGVFISKSPPGAFWFTKNYMYSSPPITLTFQPSKIDICPGGNWCIGGQNGLYVLDRSWNINPVPNSTANVTAVRFCGDTVWFGSNGFVDYVSNPSADFRQWQLKGFTVPFQVNSLDCWHNGAVVGAGSNGSVFYHDPNLGVTRAFQISTTRTFVRVALGPGRSLNGYFLDSQGSLSFNVLASDIQAPADRNSSSSRVLQFSLRTLF